VNGWSNKNESEQVKNKWKTSQKKNSTRFDSFFWDKTNECISCAYSFSSFSHSKLNILLKF